MLRTTHQCETPPQYFSENHKNKLKSNEIFLCIILLTCPNLYSKISDAYI